MDRCGLVCRTVLEQPGVTQREIAKELGVSLGMANTLVKECLEQNLLEENSGKLALTKAGENYLAPYKVDGALIIAAGFGSRFVPLTFETPKGLLEVFGERMIERQIRHLHEVGVTDITIAVGYLKEKFEYLTEKYGVKLLYNPEYSCKNTLATIWHARKVLEGRNMYLLSSDNWMRNNMYHAYECGAWYSSSYQAGNTGEWCLNFGKRGRIQSVKVGGRDSWVMYGSVYFSRTFSREFLPVLAAYYELPGTEQFYWEQVYMDMLSGEAAKRVRDGGEESLARAERESGVAACDWKQITMDINRQPENQVYEFENLEELRAFDPKYRNQSDNEAMQLIAKTFDVQESEIHELRCLKSGMTNKSFVFRVGEEHFICRIPGPGTELLINRAQEKAVYDTVGSLGITEDVLYMNSENGYKIARYYEGSRNADPDNWEDMGKCMQILRVLHASGLSVDHSFDIRERIDFYERLCRTHGGIPFEDYEAVRVGADWLLKRLDEMERPTCLCHVDPNVENYIFLKNGEVKLLDWEYSGMGDPLMDIAMCAIYSYYDEAKTQKLLNLYLGREATQEERFVVFAYAALAGLLWSLWAVYKSALGEEFGEYTIITYGYARKYYRKLQKL